MKHLKHLVVSLIVILMTVNLCGCTIHKSGNINSSDVEIVSEVTEKNDNDNIFSNYISVDSKVTYPQDDSEENSEINVYYSENVYNYRYPNSSDSFGYLDSTMMVGKSPDSDYPTYGVIVDNEYYSELLEEYKLIHFFGTNTSTCTLVNSNTIEYSDESEKYTYVYDPQTLLVVSSSYQFAEDDNPWCIEEYTYNTESQDSIYSDYANEYVRNISKGEYVTLTIYRLDGSIEEYKFPKGFSALFYSDYEYKYMDTEDIYYDDIINEDSSFIETEADEFTFDEILDINE